MSDANSSRNRHGAVWLVLLWLGVLGPSAVVQEEPEPARLTRAQPPAIDAQIVAWGQTGLQVSVDPRGRVSRVDPLWQTPGLTGPLVRAVQGWSFQPATEDGETVASQVLVAAIFRPATLYDPPGLATPPSAPRPPGLPMPIATAVPPYPIRSRGDGVTLLEVEIDRHGMPARISVATATPGFSATARDAAQAWRFEPAVLQGRSVASIAYLLFSFRAPVVLPQQRPEPAR